MSRGRFAIPHQLHADDVEHSGVAVGHGVEGGLEFGQTEGSRDVITSAKWQRSQGRALAWLDGHQPVGHLVDRAVASECGDDIVTGGVGLGQASGMPGGFGQRSGHRLAKRLELAPRLGQSLFPLPPPGGRVGDQQDALGGHRRRSAHLAHPVAGDGPQVAVAVGLRGVGGKMDLLQFTNRAVQLVSMDGRQRLRLVGVDAL